MAKFCMIEYFVINISEDIGNMENLRKEFDVEGQRQFRSSHQPHFMRT